VGGIAVVAAEPRFNPYDWETHEDPYPVYRALRERAPAYYNEELDFWALSRHADVLAAFRDCERYSNARGVALESDVDAEAVMSFLGMDPPRHDHLRSLVSRGFTPRRVTNLEPRIREMATRYIDAFIETGEADFINDFAGRLPMDVVSEMVGVPPDDRTTLRTWADRVVHREPGRPEVPPEGLEAAAQLLGYFVKHVAGHRARPGTDLTDALIAADLDGARLEEREIVAFLFLMIIAGNETTTKLLGNALYWLDKNPEQREKVLANRRLAEPWAEETLRYDPSSQLLARTLTADVELHGRKMPSGAKVALLIGAANRDERAFERPDAFDITRNTANSLAFGNGTHFCLGASLARLEARVSLEEILERLPDFQVRNEGIERVHSSNVRGFAALPIQFTPGARQVS
jgi:cytochrome P450